jgi:hypothetical protein
MAENHGSDGTGAYPKDAAHQTGDGEAAGRTRRENEWGSISIEGGIQAGIKPALTVAALQVRVLKLHRTIRTRLQKRAPEIPSPL